MNEKVLPCGCTPTCANCSLGKAIEGFLLEWKKRYECLPDSADVMKNSIRARWGMWHQEYDRHFHSPRKVYEQGISSEKAVYYRDTDRISIATPDGGLRSYGGSREEQLCLLAIYYPDARETLEKQQIGEIANERYERYYPDLVERERLEAEKNKA